MKKLFALLVLSILTISCSGDDSGSGSCGVAKLTAANGVDFTRPCAIAVSKSGMVAVSAYNGFVNGYGAVAEIKVAKSYADFKNGTDIITLTATAPEAMAFDSEDNLYVSETEQIAGIKVFERLGGNYVYKKTIQSNFNNPRGLAFNDQDQLFMADDGTGRIIRFDNPFNSNAYVTLGNWDSGIKGIAIRDNVMYITNYTSGVVSRNLLKEDGSFDVLNGGVDVPMATDVSVRGNKIIVTSFAGSTITVFSDCDFSDENKQSYSTLGKCFGTAFLSNGKVIGAMLDENTVRTLNVN